MPTPRHFWPNLGYRESDIKVGHVIESWVVEDLDRNVRIQDQIRTLYEVVRIDDVLGDQFAVLTRIKLRLRQRELTVPLKDLPQMARDILPYLRGPSFFEQDRTYRVTLENKYFRVVELLNDGLRVCWIDESPDKVVKVSWDEICKKSSEAV